MSSEEDTIGELEQFEARLHKHTGAIYEESDSSEEEQLEEVPTSELSNQNVRLQAKIQLLIQQIIDKDREIDSLKQVLGYGKPEIEEGDENFKDKKLMDLAKKNRALLVALESEKNRAARAMEEVLKLKEEKNKQVRKKGWKQDAGPKEVDWKEKYTELDKKYQELKLKSHTLKGELSKATRIIAREVGEYESLDKVLQSESWRGRAQQIESYKQKIGDMKRQINNLSRVTGDTSMNQPLVRGFDPGAEERRKEISSLKEQIDKLSEESESWKKKAQGASSRKIAIDKELKELKDTHKKQLKTLIDKTEHDDKLIQALRDEIERIRKAKGMPTTIDNSRAEINSLKCEITSLHQRIQLLEQEVEEKTGLLEVFKNYGVDDPSAVDDEMTLRKRISDLEKELKAAQEERKSNKAKGSLSEDTKMISELSQMNARLRNKVNELTEELSRLKSS
jgi:chromosome segregation ATPase